MLQYALSFAFFTFVLCLLQVLLLLGTWSKHREQYDPRFKRMSNALKRSGTLSFGFHTCRKTSNKTATSENQNQQWTLGSSSSFSQVSHPQTWHLHHFHVDRYVTATFGDQQVQHLLLKTYSLSNVVGGCPDSISPLSTSSHSSMHRFEGFGNDSHGQNATKAASKFMVCHTSFT